MPSRDIGAETILEEGEGLRKDALDCRNALTGGEPAKWIVGEEAASDGFGLTAEQLGGRALESDFGDGFGPEGKEDVEDRWSDEIGFDAAVPAFEKRGGCFGLRV